LLLFAFSFGQSFAAAVMHILKEYFLFLQVGCTLSV
jgi:hypothetical protein